MFEKSSCRATVPANEISVEGRERTPRVILSDWGLIVYIHTYIHYIHTYIHRYCGLRGWL